VKVRKLVVRLLLILLFLPLVPLLVLGVVAGVQNRENRAIVSSGVERDVLLHVPTGLDSTQRVPLVLSLHGGLNWPAFQRTLTRWNAVADSHGFIVAYPAGRGPALKSWFMRGHERPMEMPDVRFIADLIDTLVASHRVDRARVYVSGVSNGGAMAMVLSCTLSDRIAAVGLVATAPFLPAEWCRDSTPVPMIAFHGTEDPMVPYEGTPSDAWLHLPSVSEWVERWSRRNRCRGASAESRVASDVRRRVYDACTGGAAVELYTIEGGGHTWPGGLARLEWLVGRTTASVSASGLMWEFFRRYSLGADSGGPAGSQRP